MGRTVAWRLVVGGMLVTLTRSADSLGAQEQAWRVTATAAQTWFSGGLDDSTMTEGDWSLAPRVSWGFAADRALGKVRLGLGLSYVSSKIQVEGEAITITEGTLDVAQWGIAALVTVPLLRLGSSGAAVDFSAGPVLGIWTLTDEDSRTRIGGTASLQVAAPISGAWRLLATAGASVSGSPFNTGDVPPEFETTTLWASGGGLGLQYAF